MKRPLGVLNCTITRAAPQRHDRAERVARAWWREPWARTPPANAEHNGGGMSGPRVFITTLWQRTSERGNEYLSGFLGKAHVVGFRGEPTAEGIQTWDLYLTPGKQREGASADRSPRDPKTPQVSTDVSPGSAGAASDQPAPPRPDKEAGQ